VTHPALAVLIEPEFDEFLCAPIGDDRNGTGLSVLSALRGSMSTRGKKPRALH
jgi:hypothetical protein